MKKTVEIEKDNIRVTYVNESMVITIKDYKGDGKPRGFYLRPDEVKELLEIVKKIDEDTSDK